MLSHMHSLTACCSNQHSYGYGYVIIHTYIHTATNNIHWHDCCVDLAGSVCYTEKATRTTKRMAQTNCWVCGVGSVWCWPGVAVLMAAGLTSWWFFCELTSGLLSQQLPTVLIDGCWAECRCSVLSVPWRSRAFGAFSV